MVALKMIAMSKHFLCTKKNDTWQQQIYSFSLVVLVSLPTLSIIVMIKLKFHTTLSTKDHFPCIELWYRSQKLCTWHYDLRPHSTYTVQSIGMMITYILLQTLFCTTNWHREINVLCFLFCGYKHLTNPLLYSSHDTLSRRYSVALQKGVD